MTLVFLNIFALVAFVGIMSFLAYRYLRMDKKRMYFSALEDTLDMGGIGVLIYGADDSLRYSNQSTEKYFEAFGEQGVAQNLDGFINCIFDNASDSEGLSSQTYRQVFGDKADFREVVRGRDEQSYIVEMHKDEHDHTIALIRDVSVYEEQNENLTALNSINENLVLAIESASCGVFILRADESSMPVIFLNQMCRDIAGLKRSDGLPSSFLSLLTMFGQSRYDAKALIKKAETAIEDMESCQKQFSIKKDDGVFWYEFSFSPIFDHDNNMSLCVGVLTDITALKQKEMEVNRVQKLDSLGELSAGIAHDFNNILSIVEGYARMIEMNSDKPGKALEFAKKIQESSARASGLTKKMMAFARHKVVSQDSATDLRALLVEQEVLLRPLLDETIDFKILFDDGEDYFGRCESDSIVQIVMNLVVNARDAISNGGQIRVFLEKQSSDDLPGLVSERDLDYVVLRVKDNGSGMSEEVCERIFDPFYTTKEQGKGTGLGLSVIYGLVRDMGGYIDVSTELSVGTEFVVYIPTAQGVQKETKDVSGEVDDVKTISFKGFTAMIVEDESDLRSILSEFLKRHGMNVVEAGSGNEALVVQDDYEHDIDVLITDLVMPGINGLKLAEMMKALRPDIDVVFMSGYPARGDSAKVEIPEDAFFMPKPLDFDALCVHLYRTLNGQSNVIPINQKRIGEER